MDLPKVIEQRRLASPTNTPQALAWDGKQLWISSRDLGFLYKLRALHGESSTGAALSGSTDDGDALEIMEEIDPPGVVWAAVATNGAMHVTVGKGLNDDRYIYRYDSKNGFARLYACPDFTGSYLSFDGRSLYLSQWYEQRILKLDERGQVLREIHGGAEICGHVFANGLIYLLRGTENVPRPQYAKGPPTAAQFRSGAKEGTEQWWISAIDPREEAPKIKDIAVVPFACRSLTFDGRNFWSNHRAASETVCFALPG